MTARAELEGSYQLIPTRERCGMCHHVSPVGFWVPNEIWLRAVHRCWRHDVLCLSCFISQADEKMIPWDAEIKFYPVSLHTHLGATNCDVLALRK